MNDYHFIHTSSLFFQDPHSFSQEKHETGKTAWKGKKTENAPYAIEKSRTKHTIFHRRFLLSVNHPHVFSTP